ncbi:MAG TPA: hypothetical protein VM142_01865 [Acidimicrobiales bacterium]|nr:hypothetical protein [Acidimicrobiales bacterium]
MGTRLPPSSILQDIGDLPEREQDTGALPVPRRHEQLVTLAQVSIAAAVGMAVVLPWLGQVLLLDWVLGPHVPVPRSFWGLDDGLQSGMPLALLIVGVTHLVGAVTLSWLVIAAALVVGGVGAGRLVSGTLWARLAAGTLYVVNPLMFDRIFAGHVGYLLAYAVLPFAASSILRWRDHISWRGMRPALWLALATVLTPHFFWIGGVVLLAHVVTSRTRRSLAWVGLVVGATLLTSAYFIVPSVGRSANVRVGEPDLVAYRTRADPTFGLAFNVAGLYGFWRPEPKLPKEDVGGWPVFLGAIVLLGGAGLWKAGRSRDEASRHLAHMLAVGGAVGFVLALGDQGPTGPAFRFLFDHLPGFAIMREPQKFVALLALAYAVGFGFAVNDLTRRTRGRRGRLAVGALAVGLPILYTPTLFFGLAGRVDTTQYPSSWATADRLMGTGDGKVLFLPWHQYLAFPFTGRVIANPADGVFRRDAIEGDNVELANLATSSTLTRSAYLEFLFANGEKLCAFGALTAPLGVEYVALAAGADSPRYRPWLDRQVDLKRVLDRPEMVLYRNTAYAGVGSRTARPSRAADWGDLATLVNRGVLEPGPYRVTVQGPGPVAPESCDGARPAPASGGTDAVRTASPVAYRVPPGPAGFVGLPEPFDPSWRLDGRKPVELAGGTVGFATDGSPGTARFGQWRRVLAGYSISMVAVVALAVGGPLTARFRRRRG